MWDAAVDQPPVSPWGSVGDQLLVLGTLERPTLLLTTARSCVGDRDLERSDLERFLVFGRPLPLDIFRPRSISPAKVNQQQ